GYLFVGPFLSLDPGCYRVTVAYDAETPAATPPTWDVIVFHPGPANLLQIEKGQLASSGEHQLQHGFAVQPGNHVEGLHFRVRYPGKGLVRVNTVSFEAGVAWEWQVEFGTWGFMARRSLVVGLSSVVGRRSLV